MAVVKVMLWTMRMAVVKVVLYIYERDGGGDESHDAMDGDDGGNALA